MLGRDLTPPYPVRFFIVVNGALRDKFAPTPRNTGKILSRALDAGSKASRRPLISSTEQICELDNCAAQVASVLQRRSARLQAG